MKFNQIIYIMGASIFLHSCGFLQQVQTWRPFPKQKAPSVVEVREKQWPVQKSTPSSIQNSEEETDPAIPYTPEAITNIPKVSPELSYELQFKYAILLNVPVESMLNHDFIDFMEYWLGTRYRMGGHDTTGIDCSSFARTYMKHFYQLELPRSSSEQYVASSRIEKTDLKEGDLVFFFTTHRKRVSHVGVYVGNNKFAHASTSLGVIISDLNEPYYLQRFAGAGRMQR